MTDYKATLNLPKTDFPMKANLANREPGQLAKWQAMDLYQKMRRHCQDKPLYMLHDGPPYANGDIHLGHALNKILKDIIVKSKTFSGFNVPYVPGWDCHGLPIELNVEKKKGKPGHKISAKDFRQACRDYAQVQVEKQKAQFQRLGVLGEWDNPYLTMNPGYEAGVARSLGDILKNGFIKRGVKPVYWCIDCGSALAEAEVEYHDKRSVAIDVRFSVVDEKAFLDKCQHSPEPKREGPMALVIWTTTPWTLPANEAVTLGAEIDYALIQCETAQGKEQLLIAEALLNKVVTRYGIEHYHVVAYCKGKDLEGLKLQHPFYEKQVPICLGDHVTTEDGTGCVHTAPAHGMEDYVVAQAYQLPVEEPVLGNGCYAEKVPLFAGKFVRNVDAEIVALLKQQNTLLCEKALAHSYPNCWRHKTPLIYRATPQWFVSLEANQLREESITAAESVAWFPETGKNRMAAMLKNRPDWCISRQRAWGVPIPFITHKQTGEMHPNMQSLIHEVADKIEQEGIEAWFEIELESLIGAEAKAYEKSQHVLDVWYDAGLSHACVLKRRSGLQHPADVVLEGADQHRGWFQSSLLTSMCLYGYAPYRDVITHGFTVDANGRKMSKSIGNVIAPEKIIKTLGADMLRLWVSSTDYQHDMSLSDEILKRTADAYRRLRNTSRFLLSNLHGFNPETDLLPFDQLVALDRWVIAKAYDLQQAIIQAYDQYQFHIVYQLLYRFCIVDLGNFYLDIIKDRQYTAMEKCRARLSAQTALYHLVQAFVRWLAPILSFTAEEIWQHIPGQTTDSVFLTEWYGELKPLPDDYRMDHAFWETLSAVRDAVNKIVEAKRNADEMGSALEASVTLYCDDALKDTLSALADELRFVLITSDACVKPMAEASADALETDIAGLKLVVVSSEHQKCERCWQRREDVNAHEAYPGICGRCVNNIIGEGEVRQYA